MQHDEQTTSASADRPLAQGRFHIIDVECAHDLGIILRVLNLLLIARAQVASVASHADGARMHLRVNTRGLCAAQGETLKNRVEAMEGVSRVSVIGGR